MTKKIKIKFNGPAPASTPLGRMEPGEILEVEPYLAEKVKLNNGGLFEEVKEEAPKKESKAKGGK